MQYYSVALKNVLFSKAMSMNPKDIKHISGCCHMSLWGQNWPHLRTSNLINYNSPDFDESDISEEDTQSNRVVV